MEITVNKHIFIIIRYSILVNNESGWMIRRGKSFEEYKSELFSEERLGLHDYLFKKITLPSLQEIFSKKNVTVLVVTSEDLPDPYLSDLIDFQDKYQNFDVLKIRPDQKFSYEIKFFIKNKLEMYDSDVIYATVRLDDDDALSSSFFFEVNKYLLPEMSNHAISFSLGYYGLFKDGGFLNFYLRRRDKIALGLSYVYHYKKGCEVKDIKTVYDLGNHTKVDEKVPLLVNSLVPMYIRTLHEEGDSYSGGLSHKFYSVENENLIKYNFHNGFQFLIDNGVINEKASRGEGYFDGCLKTFHGTCLYFNNSNNSIEHYGFNFINNKKDLYLIRLNNDFLSVDFSGKILNISFDKELGFFVSSDLDGAGYLLNIKGEEYNIKFGNNYLCSVRGDFETKLVSHSKDWEIFYKS